MKYYLNKETGALITVIDTFVDYMAKCLEFEELARIKNNGTTTLHNVEEGIKLLQKVSWEAFINTSDKYYIKVNDFRVKIIKKEELTEKWVDLDNLL